MLLVSGYSISAGGLKRLLSVSWNSRRLSSALVLFCFVFFFLEKLRYDHLVSIIKVLVFRNSLILDCAFCDLMTF